MGLALFKDRRFSDRKKLTGLMPGRLKVGDSPVTLECRPVDISAHDLGVVTTVVLTPGTLVSLEIGSTIVELELVRVTPDFGKQQMFRYGFVVRDQSINLEKIFVDHGCMK